VAEAELSFARLLRQLRTEAGLTQEELAQAAGVSPRSVSDLERGITRTAHKDTGVLLAGALSLPGPVRELFVAAARGKAPAAQVLAARQEGAAGAFAAAATRALPRDIAAFTGRQAELAQLMGTLAAAAAEGGGVVGVHAVDGMAGIGKTTFAVHAAHRLAGAFPDGQFFLPLHAHTPGRAPVGPGDALASLLLTAGVPAGQIPPGLDARAGRWRDHVAGKKILLLLDDAASREQVEPLLPGTAGSLVLITSRRRLTALYGASVISLDTLPPAEAATLLARLAARPGLRAGDGPVGELTRLRGYLPLAIGMLASQLRHHPAWTAAELAAGLAAARDRLGLLRAENLSVAAAFDLSYADLAPAHSGCSAGSAWSLAPASTPTPLRRWTAPVWMRRAAAWMSCMTSTCSPSPRRAATRCTTCSASTPAPWPPQTTGRNQIPRPTGCWTITCTPPWPPAGTSPPGERLQPPAARPPAGAGPGPVCPRASGRLAGRRACQPARRHGLRRHPRALSVCHRDARRDKRLPGRPRPLGPVRRPPPNCPGGAAGQRPARRGRRARRAGRLAIGGERLPGRHRQPHPGSSALPRDR